MSIATERLSMLRRLAYRQAGQVVLCIIHRRGFHSVSISTSGRSRGQIALTPLDIYDKRSGRPHPVKAEREIIITLGGSIAERLATGQSEWRGTGRDLLGASQTIDLASELCPSHESARAYLRYLWLRTRDTLADPDHWMAVQLVAAELIDRRRVSGRRARQLFREATRNGQ